MTTFLDQPLNTVATYWRVLRKDGVTLGFTSHDQALYFDGVTHHSAPGIVPSAVRLTTELSDDDAEVEGALSHAAIRASDLIGGLYDNAEMEIGVVDWETLASMAIFFGSIGTVDMQDQGFVAELRSAKSSLERDLVPRTSPTCRADFCGRGCNLSAAHFTITRRAMEIDAMTNLVRFDGVDPRLFVEGRLRFLDGPQTGLRFAIMEASDQGFVLDRPIAPGTAIGSRAQLTQGCSHALEECSTRFGNATNFRGEPHLPGNDLLARYGGAS